jgi:hypothetical protein
MLRRVWRPRDVVSMTRLLRPAAFAPPLLAFFLFAAGASVAATTGGSVEVRGGTVLSAGRIRSALGRSGAAIPPTREETEQVLAALGQKLVESGYLEAEITLTTWAASPPVVQVNQGPMASWDTIRVVVIAQPAAARSALKGADASVGSEGEDLAAAPPAVTGPFDPVRLERLLWDWCDLWVENGHPFASAMVESLVVLGGRVRAGLRLDPGPRLAVEEVRYPGRVVTRDGFLNRWIRFRPGQLYREAEWQGRRRRLEQSELFDRVDEIRLEVIPARDDKGQGLRIWMPVEEVRHNRLDAALGYSGSSRTVSGFADLELGNLFGTGRQAGLRWDRFDRDQGRLQLHFHEPLLGPFPIGLRGSLEQEERDSTYTRTVSQLLFEALVGWDLTALVGGEYHRSLLGPEPSERITRVSSVVGGRWDTIRPGRWRGGRLDASFRTGRSRVRPAGGGAHRFATVDRAGLQAERFWPLPGRFVIRIGGAGSAISPADSLPPSEALRLGGTGSVRGYGEEQFATRRYGVGQLEVGLGLPAQRVYVFMDAAWYRPLADPARDTDIWGAGIGLVSETPARKVALDLGVPRGGALREGRLHLRVETRF